MKTVYLQRHAKSDWGAAYTSDFERGLKKRGKKDALLMGEVLQNKKIQPDLIVSSPANRAKLTARIVAEKIGYLPDNIRYMETIYEASVQTLFQIIIGIEDDVQSVLLFGHNPGLTYLSNFLCDMHLDNLPTAGIVGIQYDVNSWQDIKPHKGELLFFEYPKKYKK